MVLEAKIPDISIMAKRPPIIPPFNLSKFDFIRRIDKKTTVVNHLVKDTHKHNSFKHVNNYICDDSVSVDDKLERFLNYIVPSSTRLFENIKSKFPINLFHGMADELINYNFSIKAFEKLKSLGFDVEYKLQKNLGHGIDEDGLNYGLKFIKKIFSI